MAAFSFRSIESPQAQSSQRSARVEVGEHRATQTASFGGKGRVYQNDLAASFYRFANEVYFQVAPTCIQNAFREVVIANHPLDLQIFQGDAIEMGGEIESEFIEVVFAAVSDMKELAL
jgi:hypothetical protein